MKFAASHHRNDAAHAEICDALRSLGFSVQSLAGVGGGVPDVLAGMAGRNFLLEIKTDKAKLNETQTAWHDSWRGQVAVIRGVDDAIKWATSTRVRVWREGGEE